MRLAVYSRRDEIEVMSLIGGTRSFIVTPFVLEGAIIGFMGGLLCVSFLFMSEEIMTQWFQANLAEVYGPVEIRFLKGTEYAALVVIGTVNSPISIFSISFKILLESCDLKTHPIFPPFFLLSETL